jgi:hypothetical protein
VLAYLPHPSAKAQPTQRGSSPHADAYAPSRGGDEDSPNERYSCHFSTRALVEPAA